MSGGVDQVENVFLPVFCLIYGSHGLCLDGNSSLTFQIHIIQYLGLHLSFCQKTGHLDDPVCQGRFSVINMGDNTEITNFTLIKICHFCTSDFFLYSGDCYCLIFYIAFYYNIVFTLPSILYPESH